MEIQRVNKFNKNLSTNEDIIRNVGYRPVTARNHKIKYRTNQYRKIYSHKHDDMFGHTAPAVGKSPAATQV